MSQKNKIYLVRHKNFLWEPVSDEDREKANRFAIGEIVEFQSTAIRDYKNLQRYMVMIQIGFDAQEKYKDKDVYRKHLEMEAGHFVEYEIRVLGFKAKRREPKSIDYATLDEIEFTDLKKRVGDVICQQLKITDEILQEEVLKLAYHN